MPVTALKKFLDENNVKYVTLGHSTAYTAQEVAHCAHVCGKSLAKTVIILMDDRMAMVVMPATSRIRWDRFSKAMGTDFIELADEEDFTDRFPDCEIGAMPPFGNLYGLPVYMDETLCLADEISFTAGSHSEVLKMSLQDYLKLVKPMTLQEGFAAKSKSSHRKPGQSATIRHPA
jgi:Ala-tRNA(Pro) deacylase